MASAARELLNKSDNERSGVLSTAMSFLGLYRDPVVAAVPWLGHLMVSRQESARALMIDEHRSRNRQYTTPCAEGTGPSSIRCARASMTEGVMRRAAPHHDDQSDRQVLAR
ncbi:hypothetical protein A0U92_15190 [Acetobacter aceti]|uniref:Uncharacterized protein n=1 Tax=Acetobacter aceti TaxID=435 RepID=A0A1U9KJE9_ACEAC|nr:hypothetical protein A0U92_15190 [Acetobacter aceti]